MVETLDYCISFILNALDLDDDLPNRIKIVNDLERTVGLDSNSNKVYRKNYVIGLNLWLALENNLISGEGAKFDQGFETTRRHLQWQLLQDKHLMLTIPKEYLASKLLDVIQPNNSKTSSGLGIGFLSF